MADHKRLEDQDRAHDKDETVLEPKNVLGKKETGKEQKVQAGEKKKEIATAINVEPNREEPPSVSEQDDTVQKTVEGKTEKMKAKTPAKSGAKQSQTKNKTRKRRAKVASNESTSEKSSSSTSSKASSSDLPSSALSEDIEDVEKAEDVENLIEMVGGDDDSIPKHDSKDMVNGDENVFIETVEENDDGALEDELSVEMELNADSLPKDELSSVSEVVNNTIENQKNLVMPDQVQVKVKKANYTATNPQVEFDPGLFKIRVLGGDDSVNSGSDLVTSGKGAEISGAAREGNTQVQTNLQGAQVTVGEARKRLIPRVRPAQLPVAAIKVRNINGEIINLTTEIIKDKVIVQGIIHKQVFFVSTDGVVRHFAENVPFSTFIDIPGADRGMNAQVHPVIEKILFRLSPDGLFVNQKIILEIFVKVTEFIQTGLTLGEGPLLLLPLVVGEGTKQTLVENIVNLNLSAVKVDEIRGELRNIEAEIIPDKVIIQGIIHKQIFYIDTDNLARHQAEEVPFSLFIDIPGAEPGMDLQAHPVIEGIFFELLSPTELRQKVVVEVFVKVTEAIQERVVIGEGPLFKVEEVINEADKQILNESTIELERPAIKIREILGEVRNITAEVIPDKVIVQGLLHKQIFFIGTDNIEYHQAEDLPFSLFLDLPGASPGLNANVRVIIEKILFELTDETTLHQKVIIKTNVVVTETVQLPLEIGDISLFKLEQVVGEGIRQILVERREEVPPPIPPVVRNVVVVEIVPPAEVITERQQIIVENVVKLPEKAIKIREVRGEIRDLRARVIPENGVLIEGFVHKQVFFVGRDNVVRSVTEHVPFSILVNIPGIASDAQFTVDVQIENISFNLSPDGRFLRQIIVLEAEVSVEGPAPEPFQVVSEVTGPGIVTERVLVRAPVLTETGVEVQEFFVVTEVSGPGIRRVETAVVMLDVVDDGNPNPVPIEVVTEVEFEPLVF